MILALSTPSSLPVELGSLIFIVKSNHFLNIKSIILSGSPASVREENFPKVNIAELHSKYPVFGICYGAQLLADSLGCEVVKSDHREYGKAQLNLVGTADRFFDGVKAGSQIWMSHADTIKKIPSNFTLLASTESIPVAAFKSEAYMAPVYAIQFHPEVTHSLQGKKILENFLIHIAGFKGDWTPAVFIEEQVAKIKEAPEEWIVR